MERYTWRKLREMHFVYGEAEGNGRRVQRMYRERFLQRSCPHYPTFSEIHDWLGNTGTLMVSRHNAGRSRTVCTHNFEEEVLLRIENNPATSTRAIANELVFTMVWYGMCGVNRCFIRLFPCIVLAMGPDDYPSRLVCILWFLQQTNEDIQFPDVVLFTDESQFIREGTVKLQLTHMGRWKST